MHATPLNNIHAKRASVRRNATSCLLALWLTLAPVLCLAAALPQPALPAGVWQRLLQRPAAVEGPRHAHHVIQVFFDPNCPMCHKLWLELRPYVKSGKLTVRWIPVVVINDTSLAKGAAILAAKDRAAALSQDERGYDTAHWEGAIAPLDPVPEALKKEIKANPSLLPHFYATPTIVYRSAADHKAHIKYGYGGIKKLYAKLATRPSTAPALPRHPPFRKLHAYDPG